MTAKVPQADLEFYENPSFVTLYPASDRGREWIFDNLNGNEDTDTLWPVHIEHRYVADIVEGAKADGLICHGYR